MFPRPERRAKRSQRARTNQRRPSYQTVGRFDTHTAFRTWWEQGERENFALNTRHRYVNGLVEYWVCAVCFLSFHLLLSAPTPSLLFRRTTTCPARIRFVIHNDGLVFVARAIDRDHNHDVGAPPSRSDVARSIVEAEPYPAQTARVIHVSAPQQNEGGRTATEAEESLGEFLGEVPPDANAAQRQATSEAATHPPVLRPPAFVLEGARGNVPAPVPPPPPPPTTTTTTQTTANNTQEGGGAEGAPRQEEP